METICCLVNRKNEAFNEVLKLEGVEVYPSTVSMLNELKEAGAHIVVEDLEEIGGIDGLNQIFTKFNKSL